MPSRPEVVGRCRQPSAACPERKVRKGSKRRIPIALIIKPMLQCRKRIWQNLNPCSFLGPSLTVEVTGNRIHSPSLSPVASPLASRNELHFDSHSTSTPTPPPPATPSSGHLSQLLTVCHSDLWPTLSPSRDQTQSSSHYLFFITLMHYLTLSHVYILMVYVFVY